MDTIDTASDYAHEAADNIASAASQAAKTLGEKGRELKNAEQKLMKNCGNYVGDHPITSLGIAVAVGFVLRSLFSEH